MTGRDALRIILVLQIAVFAFQWAQAASTFQRTSKFILPSKPADGDFTSARVEGARARVEASPSGFVTTNGTQFMLNGKIKYFSGSNNYFLILRRYLNDDQVKLFFRVMSGNGIDLVRTWAFLNGGEDPYNADLSIQPQIGVFNEDSLKRLDLILAEASNNNVHIIFPFVNFWDDLGGMQWYVDQIMGPAHDIEEFYQDERCKQAYKNYIKKLLTRTNTINGRKYSDDPTILSLELVNEFRTTDNYEIKRGLLPGSIIQGWIREVTAYIRTLDTNHMISTGEEGFLARGGGGPTESGWMYNGTKGTDFALNINEPDIAFGTVHVYPSNWMIPEGDAFAFANDFISVRKRIADAAGKPLMLEETGMNEFQYNIPRPLYYAQLFKAARKAKAVAMLPWELCPWHVAKNDSGGFDFGVDDPSFVPISDAIAHQHAMTEGGNTTLGAHDNTADNYTFPICQANIQVGPVWNVSSSQFGAKFQIYVSAQANQSFTAPYTVTLSGPVAYSSVQPWGWNAAITPEGQVTGPVPDSFNTLKPSGLNSANIGANLIYEDSAASKPSGLSINGVKCSLLVTPYSGA